MPGKPPAMLMRRQLLDRTARRRWPRRVPAACNQPVVHQNRPGDTDIDAELCRNFDRMIAACDQFRRQGPLLRSEHIGRLFRVGEAGQIDRIVKQFDTDKLAAFRQFHRRNRVVLVKRNMLCGLRGVGFVEFTQIDHRRDREHEVRPEGVRRAEQIAHIHRFRDALDADSKETSHVAEIRTPDPAEASCVDLDRMNNAAMDDAKTERAATVALPQDSANPVLVEVTRGDMVESLHRGRVAVVDTHAKVALQWGDIDAPVYPRSAIKVLQALPLVESGAADAFGLSDAELAIACASHSCEPRHIDTVRQWLPRIGLFEDELACGAHWPRHHQATLHDMVRASETPGDINNNCSGRHAGMLTVAHHLGEPLKDYTQPTHPVQQRILGILEVS